VKKTPILKGSSTEIALITADGTEQADCTISMNAKVDTGTEASIVIRCFDYKNYYWMGMGSYGHQYSIAKFVDGNPVELVGSGLATDIQTGVLHNIKAEAKGNLLTLTVDGIQVLQVIDTSIPSGLVGIRAYNGSISVSNMSFTPSTPLLSVKNVAIAGSLLSAAVGIGYAVIRRG